MNRVCTRSSRSRLAKDEIDFIAAPVSPVLEERSSSTRSGNDSTMVSTASSVIAVLVSARERSLVNPASDATMSSVSPRQLRMRSVSRSPSRPKRAMSSAVMLDPSGIVMAVSVPPASVTQEAPALMASIRALAAATSAGAAAKAVNGTSDNSAARMHRLCRNDHAMIRLPRNEIA